MDRYAARLLLTAVLFGAVAVSATLFSDALTQAAGSEPQPVSVRAETQKKTAEPNVPSYAVSVRTKAPEQAEFITVLDEEGAAVGNWQIAEDGITTVGPLVPGIYYAKGKYTGYAQFTLDENAAVSVQAGCGWADGEQLYLTDFEPSRLELTCTRQASGLVTVVLEKSDGTQQERTGYVTDGEAVLTFDGLQPGTYDICLDGKVLRTTAVKGQVRLTVELPQIGDFS